MIFKRFAGIQIFRKFCQFLSNFFIGKIEELIDLLKNIVVKKLLFLCDILIFFSMKFAKINFDLEALLENFSYLTLL